MYPYAAIAAAAIAATPTKNEVFAPPDFVVVVAAVTFVAVVVVVAFVVTVVAFVVVTFVAGAISAFVVVGVVGWSWSWSAWSSDAVVGGVREPPPSSPDGSSLGACSTATVGALMLEKPVMPASSSFVPSEPFSTASVNFSLASVASIVSFTATLNETLRSVVAVRERRFDDAAISSTFTSVTSSVLTSSVSAIAVANFSASN
mmetsp:Transcript_4439/g.10113  ORF Transcript_4439/g.10113 Transcript_4439/m.10113 type:complete len:203 (+) Transcript_4439:185-793(+)